MKKNSIQNKLVTVAFCILISTSIYSQKPPDSNTDGTYLEINGKKIWTVTYGKGTPLILIPGGPGSAHIHLRIFDSLSHVSKLIYYDALGRGKSELADDPSDYTIERDVDDLEELRKNLGYTKMNILGHSYGTIVAQGYALKYPNNTNKLILISPYHSNEMWQFADDNCNREIETQYPELWDTLMILRKQGYISNDSIHEEYYNNRIPYTFFYAFSMHNYFKLPNTPYPNEFNSEIYYEMLGSDADFVVEKEIGGFDYRKRLYQLKMPVLILCGRYDRVATPKMTIQYKRYCPQAEFIMFERSGHNPFFEEPSKTFKVIASFLSEK